MQSFAFLINETSAKRYKQDIESLILQTLDKESCDFRIFYSQSKEHLRVLAKDCVREKISVVVAVGGDGTVHTVGGELVGKKVALGVLPIGSGNGFARHLNISLNPKIALNQLVKGRSVLIDTITMGETTTLNIAGIGFDGSCAKRFEKSKKKGFLTYVWLVVKRYFAYQPREYSIRYDGKQMRCTAFLIALCNGAQWGNGVVIAPFAKMDDGIIDLILIKPFGFFEAMRSIWPFFRGDFDRLEFIERILCKEVEIGGDHLEVHSDGEPCKREKVLFFSIKPHSLRVILS